MRRDDRTLGKPLRWSHEVVIAVFWGLAVALIAGLAMRALS